MPRTHFAILSLSALALGSCAGSLPGSTATSDELASWVGEYSGAGCLRMAQHERGDGTSLGGGSMPWFRSVLSSAVNGSVTDVQVSAYDELCRADAAFRPTATKSELAAVEAANPAHRAWQAERTEAGLDTILAGMTKVSITLGEGQLLFAASLTDRDGRLHRLVGEPIPFEPSTHQQSRRNLPPAALAGHASFGDNVEIGFTLIREQRTLRGVWRLTEPENPQRRWQGEVAFAFLDLRQE